MWHSHPGGEANGKLLLMDDMEKFAFYSTSETAFSHMLSISILHYLYLRRLLMFTADTSVCHPSRRETLFKPFFNFILGFNFESFGERWLFGVYGADMMWWMVSSLCHSRCSKSERIADNFALIWLPLPHKLGDAVGFRLPSNKFFTEIAVKSDSLDAVRSESPWTATCKASAPFYMRNNKK